MLKRKTKYVIRATPNVFGNRRVINYFDSKIHAKKELKRLLSKPLGNKTSYRESRSGIGINNPRIKKIKGFV